MADAIHPRDKHRSFFVLHRSKKKKPLDQREWNRVTGGSSLSAVKGTV
jgi:hypothetical protein